MGRDEKRMRCSNCCWSVPAPSCSTPKISCGFRKELLDETDFCSSWCSTAEEERYYNEKEPETRPPEADT